MGGGWNYSATSCILALDFQMSKPRVLLISFQRLFGDSVEALLRAEKEVELIGTWNVNDRDICERLAEARPSAIVIANGNLQSEAAAELTKDIIERYPDAPVIRTTMNESVFRVVSTHILPARGENLLDTIRGCVSPAQEMDTPNEK